jgi:hypothetical protein
MVNDQLYNDENFWGLIYNTGKLSNFACLTEDSAFSENTYFD